MIFNKEKYNYHGINFDEVCNTLEGDLNYIGTMSINEQKNPVSVFRNINPDRSKGHKDFVLISRFDDKIYIQGMDMVDFEKNQYQTGIICQKCGEFIYSINRHDFRWCECGLCFVDGGRDYLRTGGENYLPAVIDFINNEIGAIQ